MILFMVFCKHFFLPTASVLCVLVHKKKKVVLYETHFLWKYEVQASGILETILIYL